MSMIPPPPIPVQALQDTFELRDYSEEINEALKSDAVDEVQKLQPMVHQLKDYRHINMITDMQTRTPLPDRDRFFHEYNSSKPAALFSFNIYRNELRLNKIYVWQEYRGQRLAFYGCCELINYFMARGIDCIHLDPRTPKMINTLRHLKNVQAYNRLRWIL